MSDDLVGTTLNKRYFLRELAGRGGMAEVYHAWDNMRATEIAVKILRRDLASSRHFKDALAKEFELLRKLEHPNIVRVFEFESRGDVVFIVMAWVDGGNLRQRLDVLHRPMSLAEVDHILQPVCTALNYAHQMHAFHCDIKPSNIMLHKNGKDVFLADFGVARLASERGGGGTPPYMAPEQFSRSVTAKTDIYALGVTLYEMLSGGTLPYRGDSKSPGSTTRDRYAWEHTHLPLPPLSQFNPSVPQPILNVVIKALQKDPTQRFETPLAFWESLQRARASSPSVPSRDAETSFEPPPTQEPARVTSGAPAGSAQPQRTPIAAAAPGTAYLYGRTGEMAGQTFAIPAQGLKIGRGTTCALQLREKSVSRSHATVIVTRRGAYVRDDGSSAGTLLNGRRIPPNAAVTLRPGDTLQIGFFQIFEFRVA